MYINNGSWSVDGIEGFLAPLLKGQKADDVCRW